MDRRHTVLILICLSLIFAQEGNTRLPHDRSAIPDGNDTAVNEYAVPAIDSLIQNLVNQTNLDTLIHTVNILSGEDSVTINDSTYLFLSRNALHPHNDLAADFIFQSLNRFGLPTYNQIYSSTGRNVYSIKTGTDYPDKKFIICAHYDDMPFQDAPGADDNASGTAAVLEAARILSQIPTPYTIIFALWDEEEIRGFGSALFAQQAFQSGEDILGVINLDMLGWDGNDDRLIEIHTQPIANSVELANRIEFLEDYYNIGLSPVIYNPGTPASDHASFWNQGYSAVLLIESYRGGDLNPFFHAANDRIVHFDLDFFYALSKLAVATIAHLSFYDFPTHLENQEVTPVSDFVLEQSYPNPFNPSTTIEFALPKPSFVTLKVYNLLGKEVATLVAEKLPAGKHQRVWEAKGLASGVYLYRLEAGEFVQTRKLMLLR